MTIHVAMNIPSKDKVYAQAHRVLKSGGTFVVYDVLQGEGDPDDVASLQMIENRFSRQRKEGLIGGTRHISHGAFRILREWASTLALIILFSGGHEGLSIAPPARTADLTAPQQSQPRSGLSWISVGYWGCFSQSLRGESF